MTFVGKLLVVLQLVMSLCFMAMAGTVFTRQNAWNKQYDEQVAQNKIIEDGAKQTAQELSAMKEEKEKNEKLLNDQVAKLDRDLKAANDTLALKESDYQREVVQKETHKAQAQINEDEADIRRDEALTQMQINDKLNTQLNLKNKEMQGLEKTLFDFRVDRKKLVDRYNAMLESVALFKKALAANGLQTDPKAYAQAQAPPPVVDGEVKETLQKAGVEFVEISIGSDDGMKVGTILFVYRGGEGQRNKYLGEIRIQEVVPDKAVGVVVTRAKNGQIEKGDYVTTKL